MLNFNLSGKRTIIVGYLIVLVALLNFCIDILDGNGVDLKTHFESITTGLTGVGLITLRKGIKKDLEN